MSAIIEIEPSTLLQKGQMYRVWHNGEVLLEECRDPMTDGARALVERGVTGRLRMRRVGAEGWDAEGLIAVLAALRCEETFHGLRFRKLIPAGGSADD